MAGEDDTQATSKVAHWIDDTAIAIGFFTRLPMFADAGRGAAPPALNRAARAVPLAGLVIGAIVALSLAFGLFIGLTTLVTATVAVAVGILVTGALHEDGLSDTADGLGGGWSKAARLEIMRDSRVGTYGALALGLSLIGRVGAIAGILERGGLWTAILIVVSAETVSRAAPVWVLWRLPAARRSGASASAGRPRDSAAAQCFILAGIVAFAAMASATGVLATAFALSAAALATLAMMALARRSLGGQTGDIAGAAQQAALIAFLLAALAALPV